MFADGCPECGARDNPPRVKETPDDHTTVGHYTCRECSAEWETSWWENVH